MKKVSILVSTIDSGGAEKQAVLLAIQLSKHTDVNLIVLYGGHTEYKGNVDVKCASNMIVGAIINIIDNSIYWTTYAKKPERKILFKITEEIEGVIGIVIADNGIGFKISGEDAIKPFVTTKTNGLGLGLNIVSEIMIAQNGTIVFPENGDIDLPQELQDGAVVMLAFSKE